MVVGIYTTARRGKKKKKKIYVHVPNKNQYLIANNPLKKKSNQIKSIQFNSLAFLPLLHIYLF